MNEAEKEIWLNSYSFGFVDRKGKPVKNKDAEKMLCDIEYRRVAYDAFDIDNKKVEVSTVFLGMLHFAGLGLETGDNAKCKYETMIFGGKHNEWQHRWKNAAIATKAHEKIVNALKNGEDLPFEDTNIITDFLQVIDEIIKQENEGEDWKNK